MRRREPSGSSWMATVSLRPRPVRSTHFFGRLTTCVEPPVTWIFRSSMVKTVVSRRSEERRVGKECRSRWSPCHWIKNRQEYIELFFFSSRRRHTRWTGDWSSDVCSSDLDEEEGAVGLLVDGDGVAAAEAGAVDPFLRQADDVRRAAGDLDLPQFHGQDCRLPKIGRASCRERV